MFPSFHDMHQFKCDSIVFGHDVGVEEMPNKVSYRNGGKKCFERNESEK